jgi:23S rRNA (guanine745-N1)-methyltransferase
VHASRSWTCARGHAFDVARSGYVNLLQPQDRKSRGAGDPRAALDARTRLLAAGVGSRILDAFVSRAAALLTDDRPVVVDLGCGSGDALGRLLSTHRVTAIGIDLATAAVDAAARRIPAATWVVANADRRLPLTDQSVSLVLSLHARRNPQECHRVLRPGGWLLVAVPGPDDLIELRQAVQGGRVERERTPAVIAEHQRLFTAAGQATARERHHLTADLLADLLRGTYRGARASMAGALHGVADLQVTLSSEFVAFRRQ